jgi:DNA-binding MarR family transcriptional regulator
MKDEILEQIALDILTILPLFQKKLLKPEDVGCHYGIAPTHFHSLIILEEFGMLPVSDIGRKLMVSKPNMTPIIDKLIAEGFVERLPHKTDRRIINIALTDRGKQFLAAHKGMIADKLKARLSDLSEEDLNVLLTSLENIRDVIMKVTI